MLYLSLFRNWFVWDNYSWLTTRTVNAQKQYHGLFAPKQFGGTITYPWGGTDLERGYGDVPRSWPPFFRPVMRSLAYQFTTNVPLMCSPFSVFRKFCIFSLVLAKISALKTQTFPNFRSQDPLFFKENLLPRPYFWKPVWHIPTKIKLSAPPPPGTYPSYLAVCCCHYVTLLSKKRPDSPF